MNPKTKTLVSDFWGGLASMLVALPSSVAFGILVYTNLGAEYAAHGAMAGLLGAAAIGIVTPFIGRTKGLISAPCAPAAAVLSALIVGLLSGMHGATYKSFEILPLIVITTFLAAILQIFYGTIGGGKLIKFIPYQVVSGYLSGVGVIIALGQVPKFLGLPKNTTLLSGLFQMELWQWPGIIVGIITIIVMIFSPKITKRIPAVILGLASGVASYFILGIFFPKLLILDGNSLIIGSINTTGSFVQNIVFQWHALFHIKLSLLKPVLLPAVSLSVLLSIDTLKTCVGLDALTKNRHHSDRELIGQGFGNLTSALIGGMPGSGTMGPTLVNLSSGGTTPKAGLIEGLFILFALLFLDNAIAWVPIAALSGILLVIAYRMFDQSIFRLLRYPSGRLDFILILGVIVVALTFDLIAASGFGILLAVILFVRDQVLGNVIFQKNYLNQISSNIQRQQSERDILYQFGDQAVACKLQGNLFFGTTDQLYTQLESDLQTKKYILLDFRRVLSIDFTAIHLLELMHHQLREKGGKLIFSGMPSGTHVKKDFELYLAQMGLLNSNNGVMISETLDGALEWMENNILQSHGYVSKDSDQLLDLKNFNLFSDLSDEVLLSINACMTEKHLMSGEKVFSRGEVATDEIFLVRRGRVDVLLPLAGGKRHHLASIGAGGFFGELAFLDKNIRSTDAEAKTATEIYIFSRSKFNQLCLQSPEIGTQVFSRLALVIAERLRATDAELRFDSDR